MLTRRCFVGSLPALFLPHMPASASAKDWPKHTVKIIYPYAAGTSFDSVARLFAQRFTEVFGQPFIVENRPGANGRLAVEAVMRAPPDGHTFLWAVSPPITISPAIMKVPYDPIKDFVPISAVAKSALALIVNRTMPVETVGEFIEYVRARPDKLVYADAGVGSTPHLSMALFLSRAGLHMTNVSYKGAAPAFSDVIAGHVPTMFALFPDVLPHATNGAIRLLAVSSAKRLPQALDIPTISESGFPGYNTATWSGLMAPAGTAKDTVDRIAAAVEQAIKDSEIAERLIRTGIEPLGGGPSELAAMIAAEIPMWGEAAKIAGISLK